MGSPIYSSLMSNTLFEQKLEILYQKLRYAKGTTCNIRSSKSCETQCLRSSPGLFTVNTCHNLSPHISFVPFEKTNAIASAENHYILLFLNVNIYRFFLTI